MDETTTVDRKLPPLLEIYLDDHWAAAGGGAALARRVARNNSDTGWAARLDALADDIETDERVLTMLRGELGLDGGRWKRRVVVLGEVVGRFKPNGRIVSYSPLSRVLELEALLAGVTAKRCLWTALSTSLGAGDGVPSSIDFADMERRATEQAEALTALHREAVAVAFVTSSSTEDEADAGVR